MHILFMGPTCGPERTGIAPYTAGMVAVLAAQGHEVRAITAFPHYPDWRFLGGGRERRQPSQPDGVQVLRHRLPAQRSSGSRGVPEVSYGIRALVSGWGRPDVVVLVSPAMFASALLALRARPRPQRRLTVWVQDPTGLASGRRARGTGSVRRSGMVDRAERIVLRRATGSRRDPQPDGRGGRGVRRGRPSEGDGRTRSVAPVRGVARGQGTDA